MSSRKCRVGQEWYQDEKGNWKKTKGYLVDTPEEDMRLERAGEFVTNIIAVGLIFFLIYIIVARPEGLLAILSTPLAIALMITAIIVFGTPVAILLIFARKELVEAFKRDILGKEEQGE